MPPGSDASGYTHCSIISSGRLLNTADDTAVSSADDHGDCSSTATFAMVIAVRVATKGEGSSRFLEAETHVKKRAEQLQESLAGKNMTGERDSTRRHKLDGLRRGNMQSERWLLVTLATKGAKHLRAGQVRHEV